MGRVKKAWYVLNMLMASGRVVGFARNSLIWVCDGRAYRHSYVRNVAVEIGDWFSVCCRVRGGDGKYELEHIPRKE